MCAGYKELSQSELNDKCNVLLSQWGDFLQENDPNLERGRDYFVNMPNLFEVVRRVDKRKFYYKVYHKTERICEYKEVAINAFWINTLKPFMVVNEDSPLYSNANEMFSLFMILAIIQYNYNQAFPERVFQMPSGDRIRDIIYDFKYCSISREGMISFVETFADTYQVGIERIFANKKKKGHK